MRAGMVQGLLSGLLRGHADRVAHAYALLQAMRVAQVAHQRLHIELLGQAGKLACACTAACMSAEELHASTCFACCAL